MFVIEAFILMIYNLAEISTSKDDKSAISTAKSDPSAVTTTTELPVSHGAEETKDQAAISSEKADQTTPSNNEVRI